MLRHAWMLGGAGLLALLAHQSLNQDRGWRGLVLYVLAAILFAVSVKPLERTQRHSSSVGFKQWPQEAKHALLAASMLIALVLLVVNPQRLTPTVWLLQAGAIIMLITAGRLADKAPRSQLAPPTSPLDLTIATTQAILALIVVGGIWVRFRDLGGVPQGFWFDEADVALLSRRIATEGYRPVFADNVPAYDAYLMAILSKVFGEGMATIRAVSAIFGTATILAGYLVGRELFGKMGGLIIAFLVAFSRWSITLSRVGMNNVTLPLFTLLTLGFMLRGHRRQSNTDYALAGVAAGSGMLFYSAIASSLIALGLFALFLTWAIGQDKRSLGPQVLVAVVGALAVTTPLIRFMMTDRQTYFGRNANTAIWSEAGQLDNDTLAGAFKDSLSRYLPMTHYNGDRNGRHNIPGEPMLPPLVAALSALGLGTLVSRTDKWLTALCVAWIPLAFAPGVLSLPWEAPNSLRAVGVQAVAFVLAAAAILALGRTVVTNKQIKLGFLALLAVALGATGLTDVNAYFDSNRGRTDVWAVHSAGETIAAALTAEAPESTYVQTTAFLRNTRQLQYLGQGRTEDHVYSTETPLPLYVPTGKDTLILATRDSFDVGLQAERFYPNAQVTREFDGLTPNLVVVRVPADDIADSLGWTVSERDGSTVRRGVLIVDRSARYRFRTDEPVDQLMINGFEILPCDATTNLPLAAGIHLVEIIGDPSAALQWSTDEDPMWVDVPADRIAHERLFPGGLLTTHASALEDGAAPDYYEVDAGIDLRMHEFVLPRPYRSLFTGALRVPEANEYEIFLRTDDPVALTIDGNEIFNTDGNFVNTSQFVNLDQGLLPILLDYRDTAGRSEVRILWRLAGSDQDPTPIPQESLVPWLQTRRLSSC